MNKTIKITKDPNKVWFVGDLHFSHKLEAVWKERGFNSIQEHDTYLWSELDKLDLEDILINLGDACLTSNHEENFERLTKLPCQQYFLWGNHNSGAITIYNRKIKEFWDNLWATEQDLSFIDIKNGNCKEIYPFKYNNLIFIGNYATFSINKQLVIVNHFAQLIWDKMGSQPRAICLAAHSHSNCEQINENAEGKVLDIGVENAIRLVGRPYFNFVEIMGIMDKKKGELPPPKGGGFQ